MNSFRTLKNEPKPMGNLIGKPADWIPNPNFQFDCLKQGFQYTSPPILLRSDKILTLDIGFDGKIYCVERYTDIGLQRKRINAPFLCRKYPASILKNNYSDSITIVYMKEEEHIVLVVESTIHGDILVSSNQGSFLMKKELYRHEHFPTFRTTGNLEYDELAIVFNLANYKN